ncbi:MAG TPA: hypothetical protein VLM90_01005, partial [Candidatus Deferrimicrobium sp.]|nr:hypothetical protein [Candidatus Deferrimicrobium sp.]
EHVEDGCFAGAAVADQPYFHTCDFSWPIDSAGINLAGKIAGIKGGVWSGVVGLQKPITQRRACRR